MIEKPPFMGEALQELVYCVRKYGEYGFDKEHRSRLIATCESFEELRVLLAIFERREEETVDENTLAAVSSDMNVEIPDVDNWLRWPWRERYGVYGSDTDGD